VLLDAAGDVRFGEPVTDVGSLRRRFDLVVAADGIFSAVREELFGPPAEARYTGVVA
jgi:2-polyprenyl-6-methoxyphenol hydroxylase-like FAD-dependent oxidoreductase